MCYELVCRISFRAQRQERVDLAIEAGGQFLQRIAQPRGRIEAIELGGGKQTLNRRRTFARTCRSGKKPIFSSQGYGPDGVLDGVVVNRKVPLRRVATQGRPALETVVDRLCRPADGMRCNSSGKPSHPALLPSLCQGCPSFHPAF